MIITIDGPASVGKGTLSKKIADFYGLAYFDTGMVYRAVYMQMSLDGLDVNDVEAAVKVAQKMTFKKMMNLSKNSEFRGTKSGAGTSTVASYEGVRKALLKMQQDFALTPTLEDGSVAEGVIYDGRDTGTVVAPNADLKFFVTASSEVRAERRYKEFVSKGIETTYEEVLEDIKQRDFKDMNREVSPLKPAENAIVIDTSNMNAFKVFEKVCGIIDPRM